MKNWVMAQNVKPRSYARSLLCVVSLVLCLAGCLTVAPKPVTDTQASFDGGAQNSGLLGFTTNNGTVSMVVTPHALDRYNAMIEAGWGTNFTPHIKRDYGISGWTNGTCLMSLEALADFVKMNRKRKESQP